MLPWTERSGSDCPGKASDFVERRRIFHHGFLYCCRALAPRKKCRDFQCIVNAHTYTPSFKREEFLSLLQAFIASLQYSCVHVKGALHSTTIAFFLLLFEAAFVCSICLLYR